MIKFLQLNANHCAAAQDILKQTATERKTDIVLISEQYKVPTNNGNWIEDKSGRAAIWTSGTQTYERKGDKKHDCFVYTKIGGIHIYSCYAPPNDQITDFESMLDQISTEASGKSPLVIAGDFNAWAEEWGSTKTNRRGRVLLESIAKLNVVLLNDGIESTFEKGEARSFIDLTFVSPSLARSTTWNVLNIQSDHKTIEFIINSGCRFQNLASTPKAQKNGWNVEKIDSEMLAFMLDQNQSLGGSANEMAKSIDKYLENACDSSMPRKGRTNGRKPMYWWNDEISSMRKECLRYRRRQTRARSDEAREQARDSYKEAKKKIKWAIQTSKTNAFKELRDTMQIPGEVRIKSY